MTMPASECFLKALIILKKKKAGGFDHYYNRRGNFLNEREFLNQTYGFTDWHEVQAAGPGQLEGFVACQMRPKVDLRMAPGGMVRYVNADYLVPFDQWKFALRHQPFEIPGWVHIDEIKKECLKLLSGWAKSHLIYKGSATCSEGQAIVALNRSQVNQNGGQCWAYNDSKVIQECNCRAETNLHDKSTGYIFTSSQSCRASNNSRVEVFPGASVRAYNSATVIIKEGEPMGRFVAYSKDVKAFKESGSGKDLIPVEFTPQPEPHPFWDPLSQRANMPFGQPVD